VRRRRRGDRAGAGAGRETGKRDGERREERARQRRRRAQCYESMYCALAQQQVQRACGEGEGEGAVLARAAVTEDMEGQLPW
jgi:hypothetical protein